VLDALLFEFLSMATGLCCPGYKALMKRTGLCRASVAEGLARLETCGIIRVVRRLVRQRIERVSPITGAPETYVGTAQATSLYSLHRAGAFVDHLARPPPGRRTRFPDPRLLPMLERFELMWKTKLSLRDRGKPISPLANLAKLMAPGGREPSADLATPAFRSL
jgi:hypothetical protein